MGIAAFLMMGLVLAGFMVISESGDDSDSSEQNDTAADGRDDTLVGGDGDDLLAGKSGDDDITGRGGFDILLGGDGDDLLKGRDGDDLLFGGDGDDNLRGGQDDDLLQGDGGNDTLKGGEGNDLLIGADTTNRDLTEDDIHALFNGATPEQLNYRYQPPTAPESNLLEGEEGNDTLLLGENDTGVGGEGDDAFEIGEWIDASNDQEAPLITDFDEEDDVLIVRYSQSQSAPRITLSMQDDTRHVYADGQLVARVQGDGGPFFAGDVRLQAI